VLEMKKLIFLFLALISSYSLKAAPTCVAVTPSGAGSKNGTNWSNAFANLPATLNRNTIYYVADGNYGGNYGSINPADSGTLTTEIRKAQSYDFGRTSDGCSNDISTGWNTGTMGSSQASFGPGHGSFFFGSDYLILNGNGTQTTVGCGGSPGTTTFVGPTNPKDCGIIMDNSSCTTSIGCDQPFGVGGINGLIKYVEIHGDSKTADNSNYMVNGSLAGAWTMSHCYLHDTGADFIVFTASGATITQTYFWGNETQGTLADGQHGQAINNQGGGNNNVTVSYNVFRDIAGTAVFSFLSGGGTNTGWSIYGNVFFESSPQTLPQVGVSDGIIACINSGEICNNFTFNQNTVINVNNPGINSESGGSYTIRNNIYYLFNTPVFHSAGTFTEDHNSVLNTAGGCLSGTADVCNTSSPNPFTNWQGGNFTLASDGANWNNRSAIGAPYNIDAAGNTFTTDRGAYQFTSGPWATLGTMASCTGSPTGQYTQTAGSYPCFRSQAPSVFIPASALGTITGKPVYMFADGLTKGGEWGNNFYTYDPTQGTATAAFSVLWQSLDEEDSLDQPLSTIARAGGVVTLTVPTTGSGPRAYQVGDWITPSGVTYGGATSFNAMLQVTGVSNCVTANLACSTFTANQAGEDGSGTGGTVHGPAPRFTNLGSCPNLPCGPTGPLPRHNQITVYDTTRNAVWIWGGICDNVGSPGSPPTAIIVGVHGGCYEMYKMTKSGANWSFTQVHGFGTTAFNIASPNQAEPGLACTPSSNSSNCGYKFSWGGYDPANDVIVFFGGTFNSSPRNETYVYHPSTDTLNVICSEFGSPSCANVPSARSAYGDSRMVAIGGGRLLLFGGQAAGSTNNQLGDTWIFNTTNNTWTQPASANGTNPSPGLNLANLPVVMDWDPVLGKVIAVDANPAGSHTWAFDPTALTWTDLNIAGGPVLDNTNPLLPEYMGVIDTDYPSGGNGSMIIVNLTASSGVKTFYALSLPASTGPTGQIFNLSAQRITWPSTNATRPSGPSTNQVNVPVTFAIPVPDSFAPGTLQSCPNGVALYQNSLRVNSQCRMIAGWPDSKSGSTYNAQFIQLDYQYPSFTEGAADTSFVVTFEGAGSGNNPSTSMGVTCTGAGTPNAACQNSNQLLVATGAANYLFKITNTNIVDDLSIGTTHVICSASTVATGCLNHGANDGIVLFGPPSGQTTPHTVSCPLPAGGSGNGDAGASACTNAYLTANDAASTAVFEENGPMRTVVKINANLIDGSANNYNEAVTCRITLWANRVDASLECALRNANYSVTANDTVSAYKMHASMYLQYTVSLSTASNTTATFGNHTATPSTISMSATQGGYLTTGHMKYMEEFFFGGGESNCPDGSDHDSFCVWSPISRTPGSYPTGATYTQEGYVVTATGGATVTGTASGTNVQIPPGWSDVTDANGLGIEVGEFLMAAYWPASQEFQSGGTVVRVGMNPDESLFGTGGQAYVMGWPKYTLYRSYLNPHVSALTNTQLSDSFLAWQLPVVGEYASPASYNGAKDNAFGRLALLYPLPDPVVFDNYSLNLGGFCPGGIAGSCLPDIGGTGYTGNATIEAGNQAGGMTRFRFYPWGDGGGANQQEWAFSLLNNWLSWKTGGRYMQSWLWYWYVLEGAMPRADWVTVPGGSAAANEQGWRCASAPNCPDIASVPCAALHCANEDNYGHPAQTNINLNGTGLNVGQRNWTPNADNGQHYHWYGMVQFYELTGWEWAKDFLLQAGKDELLNANTFVNDATRSGGGDFIFSDRVFGHRWMAYARLSMFFCAIGDPDCDGNNGSNVSPKSLTSAENHLTYAANPNLIAFGYPLQSGGTPVTQPTGCTTPTTDWGPGCSQGISPVTGFSYGGDDSDSCLASPSLVPCDNGSHRISSSFFWDRKVNGLLELEWAELSARGTGWKITNAKNGGVSFGDNCGTTYPCYSLPMLAYGISNSFTQNMYVLGSTFSNSGSVYVSYLDYLNSTCGTTHACTTTQTPPPGSGPCDNTFVGNSGFFCGTNGPPQNLATHWTHFATTCAFSGSTVNFDTADNPSLASGQWQQKFEFLLKRLNTGQSFSEDRSYDLTWAWDCVRKHNPTIASFPLASNIVTMQSVPITVTDGTHTGYCIGSCTITWTKPLNLSTSGVALPQGNVFYQLVVNECVPGTFGCPSPAGFPVVNWLPFYRNCTTTSTTNECTANTGLLVNNPCNGGLNATDQTSSAVSGCWGPVLPTASTNFFTATPIANPSSAATSASFTCPASNVCTFALKGALTQISAVAPAPAPGLFGK
jgi:Galactose oxidase, central domain